MRVLSYHPCGHGHFSSHANFEEGGTCHAARTSVLFDGTNFDPKAIERALQTATDYTYGHIANGTLRRILESFIGK